MKIVRCKDCLWSGYEEGLTKGQNSSAICPSCNSENLELIGYMIYDDKTHLKMFNHKISNRKINA